MKKILFLLLLSVTMYGQVPADATPLENIQITNNIQDTISDRVSVSTSDGVLNWKYAKDLIIPAKAFLSTGLIKNGLLSINADPTKFNITAGIGIISNFDNPENPTSTIINFPTFTAVTPTYLLTGSITYVAINSTPAVVMQATAFTPEQRRSLIVLGAVIHSNLTNINVVNNISAPSNASTNQLHDFIEAVGALNLTGNKYTANGANLQLNKSAGLIFKLGSNFANDWKNPHELAQTAGTSLTFRYRTQNGTEGSDRINLDPALYDLNNVLTAVPNNKFTIQTVTMFQSGVTRIQYGQNVYDDLATARNAVFTRNFVLEPNSKENGIIRAYIIMKNTTTSLQNVADSDILEAQKFGGVASGGVALTDTAIISALGYTPENSANKGIANGYASLDINGKVPLTQINDALIGSVNYKGTYNASTNTPALPAATTNKGNYYVVTTGGVQFSINFVAGDWIISNGTNYEKVDNNNNVTSVAGKVGAVSLVNGDVGLGNVDNTSDLNKPISTATQTALNAKLSGTGTTNYISKFTGSGTVGNSSIFDDGSAIRIGTVNGIGNEALLLSFNGVQGFNLKDTNLSASGSVFQVFRKSDDTFLGNIKRSGVDNAIYFGGNDYVSFGTSDIEKVRIINNGNVGIGTISPTEKIDVVGNGKFSGNVTATSFNGSATLTGTPTAPTATAGTNTTQIATTAFVQANSRPYFVQANSRPYKVYTALLTQTGTSAPTATVLENTLGGTIVWSYSATGVYVATLSGAFTSSKTSIQLQNTSNTGVVSTFTGTSNFVSIATYDSIGTSANGKLTEAFFEIRVYN